MCTPKSSWILGAITKRGQVRLLVETSPPLTLSLESPIILSPDCVGAPVLGFLLEAYGQLVKYESVQLASEAESRQCVPRHPDYDYTVGGETLRLWVLLNK